MKKQNESKNGQVSRAKIKHFHKCFENCDSFIWFWNPTLPSEFVSNLSLHCWNIYYLVCPETEFSENVKEQPFQAVLLWLPMRDFPVWQYKMSIYLHCPPKYGSDLSCLCGVIEWLHAGCKIIHTCHLTILINGSMRKSSFSYVKEMTLKQLNSQF